MMSHPASVFVIVFTLLNIGACLWLMWWTARTRAPSASAENPEPRRTGHVWDGDLEEYNNPLPRWWLGLFIITIVFSVGYLVVYPGLGNFAGTKGWSQIDQHQAQVAEAQGRLERRLASLKDKPLHDLARDPSAMSTAKNLFGANCSTCHGSDARGAKGFPNLTDRDWLWGGSEDTIYASVANGRHGIMPAMGDILGNDGVNEVASYVVSLAGRRAPADWVTAGKTRFEQICAACHAIDGRGNAALGAPNLTDDVWLHGSDFDSIRTTIMKGRDNEMPAHLPLLGDAKVRLLAAYILSLSVAADERVAERDMPSAPAAAEPTVRSSAPASQPEIPPAPPRGGGGSGRSHAARR
jgi:cytochrome c oxidase cbb3-type subunit 3